MTVVGNATAPRQHAVYDDSCAAPGTTAAAGTTAAPGMTAEDAERAASVFKALADPIRLRLYSRIAACDSDICVCDIQHVGVSQPTVSHHLRKLRDAGLIDCERRGTWVYYWAVPGALSRVFLGQVAENSLDTPQPFRVSKQGCAT